MKKSQMKNKKSSDEASFSSIGKILNDGNLSLDSDSQAAIPEALQYDLWSNYWGYDKKDLSNSVEFWDAIPTFSIHRNKQITMRDEYGRLGIYRQDFVFKEQKYELSLQPALVLDQDGRDIAYYPASDEELIWELMIKLFGDQSYAVHNPNDNPPSSFIRFSLRLLQRELGRHNHKRSLYQIRHAIEVLSRAVVIVSEKDNDGNVSKPLYRFSMLNDVLDITRADYLDDPTRFWVARLPVLISASLKTLEYRQYNCSKSIDFKDRLSSWMQKRLTHRFLNASLTTTYHIAYSTIREESGRLSNTNKSRNIKRIDKCIKELINASILCHSKKKIDRDRGQGTSIREVVWVFRPHPNFAREIKAANGRCADAKKRVIASAYRKV